MSEQGNHEFSEIERQLTQFTPRASRIDRASLLFRAGQESVLSRPRQASRSSWLWPLSTAAMTIVSAGLSWQLYVRGDPSIVEPTRIVERSEAAFETDVPRETEHVEEPRVTPLKTTHAWTAAAIPRDHYLRRRELALTIGIDALTVPVAFRGPAAAGESSYRDLRSAHTKPSSVGDEQESEQEPMSNNRHLGDKS